MATQSRLLSLPKELRLQICEAVYPLQATDSVIDLHAATPPTNALRLTCKQLHNDIGPLYKHSFRIFWTTSNFLLTHEWDNADASNAAETRDRILTLPLREIQHITHLTVIGTSRHDPGMSVAAYQVHPTGGWKIVTNQHTTFRRYRKSLWRKDAKSESVVVPTRAAYDGHGNEEQLREACERCTCGVPRVNQILHLCALDLVDLSAAEWWR